jgi:phasin family protein
MATPAFPTFEEVFEPFMAYGKLATEATEKALKVQMDGMKKYSKMGMDNMTEGMKVTDFDQLVAYMEKQKTVYQKASEQMIADSKTYTDIGTKFFESSKALAEDTYKSSVEAAKEVTKEVTKAAKAASK